MLAVSRRLVLEAAAELASSGGASLALVAWEVCVEEHEVAEIWERAVAHGLLKPFGPSVATARPASHAQRANSSPLLLKARAVVGRVVG